jgi:CRP-like cAMP-binding protein
VQEVVLNPFVGVEEKTPPGQGATTSPSRRLGTLAALSADDLCILRTLKGRTVAAGTIVHSGSNVSDPPCYFLSGWGARLATGVSDNRQIVTLLLPGDGFGIGASPWAGESLPVRTLADSVLLDATTVRELVRQRNPMHSRLVEACERASWLEQRYALNHIVRLGRQNAYERVAHFIRELFDRLNDVGLVDGNRFHVPLRQKIIADVLGLSCVHFNRVARRMKKDGLIEFPRGAVHILDPVALAKMTGAVWIS